MPVRRLLRLVAVAALVVAIAAGCDVATTVDIRVAPDGSGSVVVAVRLDRAAAARVPDLDQTLLVSDLEKAGWSVSAPMKAGGGGVVVRATRQFADAAELGAIMDQLAGTGGAFRGFTLERSHSFAKTTYTLKGTVDLHQGLGAFGDPALRAALGGTDFGRTDAQLASELGGSPRDHVHVTVRAHLPGGRTDEWKPALGDPALTVEASSADRAPRAWLFAFAALIALVGFVGTVFLIARHNRITRPPSYVHRPGGPRRPWED